MSVSSPWVIDPKLRQLNHLLGTGCKYLSMVTVTITQRAKWKKVDFYDLNKVSYHIRLDGKGQSSRVCVCVTSVGGWPGVKEFE